MKIIYFAYPDSRHDYKWVDYFSKNNQVIVVCSKFKKNLFSDRVKVYDILPPTFPALNLIKRFRVINQLSILRRKEKPDVVHILYAKPTAIWVYLSGFKNYIITTRGSDVLIDIPKFFKYGGIRLFLSNILMRYWTKRSFKEARIVTCTSMSQIGIGKSLRLAKKFLLVRTGVDLNAISDLLTETNNHKELGCQGRIRVLSPRYVKKIYNIDIIIESISILRDKGVDVLLTQIIGDFDHDYLEFIKNRIDYLDLNNNVSLIQYLEGKDFFLEYTNSDIAVMIPSSDGTPNSGIECMYLGTPLILGSVKYDSEIFNEDSCWFCNDLNPETLADLIQKILLLDKDQRLRVLSNAKRTVENIADLKLQLQKVEEIYQTIT